MSNAVFASVRRWLCLIAAVVVTAVAGTLGTPASATTISRQLSWTATFPHFSVTVGDVVNDPAQGRLVYTVVCVRSLPAGSTGGGTRISWDPWTMTTTSGTVHPGVYDASHLPAQMFPRSATYRVGDCAGGWLPYATASGATTTITYANSLGDRAVWTVPPRTADTALGVSRTFPHFTARVLRTTVSSDGSWAGAYVQTCVRSLPAGTTGGVALSQLPWTMTSNRGLFTTMIMQEGAPIFGGRNYPWTTTLTPGHCAEGWVAFALIGHGDGLRVDQVSYRNFLGDHASWAAR